MLRNYDPSYSICGDESMSRWYGIVGHRINAGLPKYIAIDKKPENGRQIQNPGPVSAPVSQKCNHGNLYISYLPYLGYYQTPINIMAM